MRRIAACIAIVTASSISSLTATADPPPEVGIVEHLGETIPLDLVFRDEQGNDIRLREVIDRPTFLLLVYYECPGVCGPLLSGAADVFDRSDMVPGKDYRIVTISFDPSEGPDLAVRKRDNYLKTFSKPFPPEGWRFLTASEQSRDAITRAVGFHFKKQGDTYLHAAAMMAISPKGKIVRYLYGITFLPFDVKMAAMEASAGRVGPTVSRVLLYCFSYDPEGKTYVFNILKVTGTLTTFFGLLFLIWLVVTTRRHRERERHDG